MAGMASGSASRLVPTSWEISGRKAAGSMPWSRAQSARQFEDRREGSGEWEVMSRLSEGERRLAFFQEAKILLMIAGWKEREGALVKGTKEKQSRRPPRVALP